MCEQQVTVDICINLKTVRNLSEDYATKFYFRVWVAAGDSVAAPYQVIPHSPYSAISLTEYISPLITLGPYSNLPLSQLAVFKVLIPLQALQTAPLRVGWQLLESCLGGLEVEKDRVELEYSGVVGLNSYMPVCFTQSRCAVDAILTTQLLSCRFKNILATPKTLLYLAVEGLLIAFNRLREKLNRGDKKKQKYGKCEFQIQSFPQMEDVRKFARARIFKESEQEQRQRLLQFHKRLPRVSFCVQQLWTQYLQNEIDADIDKYRQSFLLSYSQQVRHNVYVKQTASEVSIVDGLRLAAYPLTVKTLRKPECQGLEREEGDAPHLIFLVHGYGASSKALEQLELGLRFFYPHLYVVSSKVNENRTDDSLQEMGRRLALEVEASIEALGVREEPSLSFIGHSLGGLIIRSAMGLLEKRRFNMRLYVSLGTPHLGYLYHNSRLTKAGMWALNLFKQSSAMSALLMETPTSEPRLSYLYELSKAPGLNWFQQALFYAGLEDYFVSAESALMEANQIIQEDKRKGVESAIIWEEMRMHLEDTLGGVAVGKYLVDFQKQNLLSEGSMADQLLGRRDHINLATSSSFVLALLLPHAPLLHSLSHSLTSSPTHSSLHDSV